MQVALMSATEGMWGQVVAGDLWVTAPIPSLILSAAVFSPQASSLSSNG